MRNWKGPFSKLKSLWWWLRQMSGDAAYENYLRSVARKAPNGKMSNPHPPNGEIILSREDFFQDALRRRYNSVSRCC